MGELGPMASGGGFCPHKRFNCYSFLKYKPKSAASPFKSFLIAPLELGLLCSSKVMGPGSVRVGPKEGTIRSDCRFPEKAVHELLNRGFLTPVFSEAGSFLSVSLF